VGILERVASITEAAFREFLERLNSGDLSALDDWMRPDYEEVWPQFGERVRGVANFRAILENYPGGGLERSGGRIVSGGDEWVMAPNYTIVRVEGSGDRYTGVVKSRYPDQSTWYVVSFVRFLDGKAMSGESYFAPELPAPEWRIRWVEPIEEE
jgi:hypothetical protein